MKATIVIVIILTIATAISCFFITTRNQLKVAYVDNDVLFEGYTEKKELEKEFISVNNAQKAYLDSLGIEILALRKANADSPLLKSKEEHYEDLLYQMQNANQAKEQEYMKNLWTKINQYVQDYGKENGYDFIYGATGNGSIMYADTVRNITPDVLKYVNQKYEGAK